MQCSITAMQVIDAKNAMLSAVGQVHTVCTKYTAGITQREESGKLFAISDLY